MAVLNPMPPYTLFGIEDQDYKKAKVAVLPIPYDATSTYRVGSREGPHALITASRAMEHYSEELNADVSKMGIFTLNELAPDYDSPKKMVDRIAKEVSVILDDGKFPLLIGGEHTIAVGAVKAFAERSKDFSVLHFDAHADSRDELFGTKYCHACIMARIRELCGSAYSVGIRSTDEKSAKKYAKTTLYMKDMKGMSTDQVIRNIVKNTKDKVYITIDLDVLDPSEMPSTGTPEPGGMRYRRMKEILKGIAKKKKIIGMDFSELNPIPGMVAPDFMAAKLVYFSLGYIFA